MASRRFLLLTLVVALVWGLAGAPAGAEDKEPIKYGFLDTMSGPFGVFGKGNIGAVKLAIKEINEAGGILGRRVELVMEDDEANTEVAARKAKKMILQDKVNILHGAASTSCSAMIMKVAGQYKTLHIDTEFDSASILPMKNDYSFMFCPMNEELERARMLGLKELLKPEQRKRWMIWYPDYSYGRDMKAIYERELKKIVPDAEIVGILGHPLGESDYSTYFVKIFEANPQVFISVDWAGDATNFIKQAIPYGFFEKVPVFSLNGAAMSTIIALGEKLPPMYYMCEQGNPYFAHLAKWREKYHAYTGEWPTEDCSPNYYEGVYMFKAAVEKARSLKAEDLVKALEGMEFVGPTGKRKVRKDHFADLEYIAVPELVKSDAFPFKVPGRTVNIPYEKVRFSTAELVAMGCKWCEGR